MASGLSAPHEWQATGGVEVKGKGTMDTFLFLPDAAVAVAAAAAAAALPSEGGTAASPRRQHYQQLGLQRLGSFDPRASEKVVQLMEASRSVASSAGSGSRYGSAAAEAGQSAGHSARGHSGSSHKGPILDDIGVERPFKRLLSGLNPARSQSCGLTVINAQGGTRCGSTTELPPPPLLLRSLLNSTLLSSSTEESPFSAVGEVLSALRVAQEVNPVGRSMGRTSSSVLSAHIEEGVPQGVGSGGASSSGGGGGSGGRAMSPPPLLLPHHLFELAASLASASGNDVSRSGNCLSSVLLEALGSTAGRHRPTAAAAAAAMEAARRHHRHSNEAAAAPVSFAESLS